jgi:hypothetical protein
MKQPLNPVVEPRLAQYEITSNPPHQDKPDLSNAIPPATPCDANLAHNKITWETYATPAPARILASPDAKSALAPQPPIAIIQDYPSIDGDKPKTPPSIPPDT